MRLLVINTTFKIFLDSFSFFLMSFPPLAFEGLSFRLPTTPDVRSNVQAHQINKRVYLP